jgi:hypothetical protein
VSVGIGGGGVRVDDKNIISASDTWSIEPDQDGSFAENLTSTIRALIIDHCG